ncbi:protein PDF [Culicoides brevitarsis]|uniref:protein PDF n=1 Tax=Culicoides brevitarsis TaxID=469753 RepID=UPI00307CAE30
MDKSAIFGILAVLLCVCATMSFASPTPDEEHYFDKEDVKELAAWLSTLGRPMYNNYNHLPPCRPYYMDTQYLSAPMPKRNSELINSLLSLPKTMSDAGK